jgi:DNA primase
MSTLIRTDKGKNERWLLVKMKDRAADARRNPVATEPLSVVSGRDMDEMTCDNVAALVSLINQGVVTMQPWLSRVDNPACPDRMIFDLDPPGDDFDPVVRAAALLKELLDGFDGDLHAKSYTIANIFLRLGQKEDPWKGLARRARSLHGPGKKLDRLLGENESR